MPSVPPLCRVRNWQPDSVDTARFDEYSRKVRELTCFDCPEEYLDIYSQLARLRPTGNALCPSLTVLRWVTTDGHSKSIVPYFIAPSLRRVHVLPAQSVSSIWLHINPLRQFLAAVAGGVPSLQHLDIHGPVSDDLTATLAEFKPIPSIRIFGMPMFHSTLLIFSNSLRNLVRLEIDVQSIELGDLPATVFPSLEALHITGYVPFVSRILHVTTASRLRVFSVSTDNSGLEDVFGCLEEVYIRFGKTLRSVSVVMLAKDTTETERHPSNLTELTKGVEVDEEGPPASIMAMVLNPLLQIQELEDLSVHFKHPRAFLYEASVKQMASTWRNLKSLSITGRWPLHSLHCLIDLANLCPNLTDLCIQFSAIVPPPMELWKSPPEHNLRTLCIRNFLFETANDYPEALKYFDHLFPRLRCGNVYEWRAGEMRWEAVFTLRQPYQPSKHWGRVT